MSLIEQVARFQVAPKYNICIGKDNAELLVGLIKENILGGLKDPAYLMEDDFGTEYIELRDLVTIIMEEK